VSFLSSHADKSLIDHHVAQKWCVCSTMTMEELLSHLMNKTKYDCEEAHRRMVFASTGLAGLHIIKEQVCNECRCDIIKLQIQLDCLYRLRTTLHFVSVFSLSSFSWRMCRTKLAFSQFSPTHASVWPKTAFQLVFGHTVIKSFIHNECRCDITNYRYIMIIAVTFCTCFGNCIWLFCTINHFIIVVLWSWFLITVDCIEM